ncbi:GHMP family kinase ATP-binding protein [Amycolatopsis thermoflava]|uniref:GHMP family kinase ATP-binding protein n=1 Tax=Amycolatopsis thermoflava TaxID=84480 RepID=UPI003EB78736
MTGVGHAPGHHGEILQGVFRDRGRRCRGLVTLPVPGAATRAEFVPGPGPLTVTSPDRAKARRAAELAAAACGRPAGGSLRLDSGLPVGLGLGSSTSDILATVRAVSAAFGVVLAPEAVARIAVRAERACDPIMLGGGAVLFAQREGRVLERLGPRLPPVVVIGCVTGGGAPVDTLALGAVADVAAFERLRRMLRLAIVTGDVALLGRVSTESARLNQRVLAKDELPELERIAAVTGAAGVQVAHSGNVAGLLFDPGGDPDRVRRCVRALRAAGLPATRLFTTEGIDARPHRGGDRAAGPGPDRRPAGLPAV